MIKIIILLALIALTYQKYECRDFGYEHCNSEFRCAWEEPDQMCIEATYIPLEHHRKNIPHYVIFDNDPACDYIVGDGDFTASQSFKKSQHFRSFCRFYNVLKIKVRGTYYSDANVLPSEKYATSAVIYPEAREGCALLYAKKFYRGKSWEICKPTQLYESKIRSMIQGRNTQLSLYDYNGHPLKRFQQKTFDTDGITKFKNDEVVEFVLLEKYDD